MSDQSDVQYILKAASRLDGPDEMEALLARRCPDSVIRRRVKKLLEAHPDMGAFFVGDQTGAESSYHDPLDSSPSTDLGRYKIREQIGEGGMGVVYVAEQIRPVRRMVALKIIKPGMDTKEIIARFEAERQALAFMEHPNIARVFDAGATESGRPFFAMELVRGIPITEYCDQDKMSPPERLRLFIDVCNAVQHAHQKGIIHRDIKPSNVLVTQISGEPVIKVIDFGLAKATGGQQLSEKTVYTGYMRLLGTPAYMSPEQAGISGLDVDTRSDIYSLGVLLYELLTGTTPLDRKGLNSHPYEDVCRQIRETEAPRPSARLSTLESARRSTVATQRGLPPNGLFQVLRGDLDRVVLKSVQKDRQLRYQTPRELADDVQRFLDSKPVLAVPPGPLYVARKYFHRHRLSIAVAATIATLLLVGTAVSTTLAIRATRARQEATRERDKTTRAMADLQKHLYTTTIRNAAHAVDRESPALVSTMLDSCSPQLRQWEWEYLQSKIRRRSNFRSIDVSKYDLTSALFDPSGQHLVVSGGDMYAQPIRVFSAATGTQVRELSGEAKLLAFVPGTRKLVSASFFHVELWDFDTGERLWRTRSQDSKIGGLAISPDGTLIATGGSTELEVNLWNTETGSLVRTLRRDNGPIGPLAFSPDGTSLAAATFWQNTGGPVTLWNVQDGTMRREFSTNSSSAMEHLAFDPRGSTLATACSDATVRIWDVESGEEIHVLVQDTKAQSLAYSPDGERLAIGDAQGAVSIWESDRGRRTDRLLLSSAAYAQIKSLQFHADGHRIIAGGGDGSVYFGELVEEHLVLRGRQTHVWRAALSRDESIVATAGMGNLVTHVWDMRTGEQLLTLDGHEAVHSNGLPYHDAIVWSVDFSPSGDQLLTSARDGQIIVWDVKTGQRLKSIRGYDPPFPPYNKTLLALFSPDGKQIVSCCYEGKLRFWDVQTARLIRTVQLDGFGAWTISYSRDGKTKLLARPNQIELRTLQGDLKTEITVPGSIFCANFNPSDSKIVTAGADRTVRLFDVKSGKQIHEMRGHQAVVWYASFSQDGNRIFSAGEDARVGVWDVDTGSQLLMLTGHAKRVSYVSQLSDGKSLLTCSHDGTARIWDVGDALSPSTSSQ